MRPPGYWPPAYRPPPYHRWPSYGLGYWNRYPWHWGWVNHDCNWWAWATAGAVTGWLGTAWFDTAQPVYYSYGDNLYYEGDTVYYNEQPVASTTEYAQQAQQIAEDVPDVQPDQVDWLPLGVFALTENDETAEDATMFLQLAISKEGIIAGTFQNTTSDESFEVQGTIDKESQRAAWGPRGKDWPIMETGLYNLTENQCGALIHFSDSKTQQWYLFRMDEDEKNKASDEQPSDQQGSDEKPVLN